jgi:hypothetical protein
VVRWALTGYCAAGVAWVTGMAAAQPDAGVAYPLLVGVLSGVLVWAAAAPLWPR